MKNVLKIICVLCAICGLSLPAFANDPIMVHPPASTGAPQDVFQNINWPTGKFRFNGAIVNFGTGSNNALLLDGSGLVPVTNIPGLPAAIITSGTFPDARIASAATWNAKVGSIVLNADTLFQSLTFTVTSGAASGTRTLNTQSANLIFAGPSSGSAAVPTFRSIVANDLPGTLNATTFSGNINIASGYDLNSNGIQVLRLHDNANTVLNPVTSGGRVYLNYDRGAGISFGDGAGGVIGNISTAGNLSMNGTLSGSNLTLGGNLVTSGAFNLTLTLGAATNVTLPASGTLATRAGSEAFTNKDFTGAGNTWPTFNQNTTGSAATLTTPRSIYGNNFDGSGALAQVIAGTYGGTGVNNGAKTITLGGNLITSGAFNVTFTLSGTTNVTLPLSGTLATLAGSEAFTNKDFTGAGNTWPTFNQNTTGSSAKWTSARNLAGNSVDGSANVAFANKFIVQGTADAGLSGSQFLGSLSTGIVKNTTSTGVLSIAVAGDFPTLNQNTTGSAATLTNPRTIGGVSFDGSANITVATATGGFTISGGDLALGVNNLTMTGSIGSTGSRVTKGWFTDLQVTNSINGSITGNAATVTTDANLTGPITSSGNATSIAAQTGTGTTFVMSAGPTFTGAPAAPTAAVDTNTTQLATSGFVLGQAGGSNPLIDGAAAPGTSLRYSRQDHVHPTDTSREPAITAGTNAQFIRGDKGLGTFASPAQGMTISNTGGTVTFGLGAITPTSVAATSGVWINGGQTFPPFSVKTGTNHHFIVEDTGGAPRLRVVNDGNTASGALEIYSAPLTLSGGNVSIPNGDLSVSGNLTVGNTFNAAAHTIGVNSSYQPTVTVIGDSIAQLVANLAFTQTVTTTSGSAAVTVSGSISKTVTTTNASPTVTTAGTFTDIRVGAPITGTGIPANSYVGIINSATSIGLSSSSTANVPVNATASGSITVSISLIFTDADVGSSISGTGIPSSSYIGALISSTSIGLSSAALTNVPVNATASGSITATITPYGYNNYMGALPGAGSENITVPAIGQYNGLWVAPRVGQNVAVAGKTIEQLYEAIAPLTTKFRQESGMNIAVVGPGPGTNNLGLLNDTPAMTYSKLEAFCRFLRQNNYRVVVVGLISRGNGAGASPGGANTGQTWDQLVGSVNGLIRQNWAQFADRFVDWGIIGSGSNEFAAGGYSNTTYYSTDQLHPTYAGSRKLAGYVNTAVNDLLTYYFQNHRNQLFVNMNKASHTNVATDGMLTLRNENPSAGQSEINFSYWNGTAFVLKENIRASVAGDLNFGATGYVADYIGSTGPDVYGTNGSDGPPLIFYRDTNGVKSYRPFQALASTVAPSSGTGVAMYYDSTLNYGHLTSYKWDATAAWKPWVIEGSTVKIATNGTDRMILQAGVNIGGTTDPGAGNLYLGAGNNLQFARISAATSPAMELFSTNANANARTWALLNANAVHGDFTILQGTSAGSDPLAVGGNPRLYISFAGGITFNGTTDSGAGNLMLAGNATNGGVIYFGNSANYYLNYVATTPAYYNFAAGINLIADGYTVRSTREMKQDIVDLPRSGVLRLRPRAFKLKNSPAQQRAGFVAEEVLEAMPEAVTDFAPVADSPQRLPAIDPMTIMAGLVQEVQQQRKEIEELKAKR